MLMVVVGSQFPWERCVYNILIIFYIIISKEKPHLYAKNYSKY